MDAQAGQGLDLEIEPVVLGSAFEQGLGRAEGSPGQGAEGGAMKRHAGEDGGDAKR
jgi:hypothetical protein